MRREDGLGREALLGGNLWRHPRWGGLRRDGLYDPAGALPADEHRATADRGHDTALWGLLPQAPALDCIQLFDTTHLYISLQHCDITEGPLRATGDSRRLLCQALGDVAGRLSARRDY